MARRLREQQADGVVAAVMFPNTLPPFAPPASTALEAPAYTDDFERRWAGLRAHNRWLLDLVSEAPERCAGIAQVFLGDVESSVVAELCARDDAVVTFGGGTLMRPVNQEHARRDGLLVYLEADAEELWRRIEADPASAATRPNLAGGGLQEVVTMLARRAPVYRANADLTLDATLPPAELADRIVAAVRDRQRAGRR